MASTLLPHDGSAEKKVRIAATAFMGLAHIIYLRDHVKGFLFAFIETLFLLCSPLVLGKIRDLITLRTAAGSPHKMRGNSMFMLIDGILMLAVVAVFVIIYVISVRSARAGYREYCGKSGFPKRRVAQCNPGEGVSLSVSHRVSF